MYWIKGYTGCIHVWCDNQAVVDLLRDLQRGTLDITTVEHSDLWRHVHELWQDATAQVYIHKVYSHDEEVSCTSPSELEGTCSHTLGYMKIFSLSFFCHLILLFSFCPVIYLCHFVVIFLSFFFVVFLLSCHLTLSCFCHFSCP